MPVNLAAYIASTARKSVCSAREKPKPLLYGRQAVQRRRHTDYARDNLETNPNVEQPRESLPSISPTASPFATHHSNQSTTRDTTRPITLTISSMPTRMMKFWGHGSRRIVPIVHDQRNDPRVRQWRKSGNEEKNERAAQARRGQGERTNEVFVQDHRFSTSCCAIRNDTAHCATYS